jgi:hypothetical protein
MLRILTSIFVVDLEQLGRVVDAAPAHVGDVQQAVDPAEVDERAEVGDVLDHAGDDVWPSSIRPSGALSLAPRSSLDELAAADDDVAAIGVDLEDLRRGSRPMYSPMSWGRRMSTCEAGRKTGTPMSTSRPPLILRMHLALDDVALPCGVDDRCQAMMRSALRLESSISPPCPPIDISRRTSIESPMSTLAAILPFVGRSRLRS